MVEEKKKTVIGIGILIIFIVMTGIFIFSKSTNHHDVTYITSKISMVTDNSRFYTVSSCVSKYLTYLSSSNSSALLQLLDSRYKEENKITLLNINDFIKPLDQNYEFVALKMYQEKFNDNIMKYYVYGTIRPEQFYETVEDYYVADHDQDYYIIIYLDFKNQTFSVEPDDGTIFKGGNS